MRQTLLVDDVSQCANLQQELDAAKLEIAVLLAAAQKNRYLTGDALRSIINLMPGHVYWKDLDFRYQGCNQQQAISAGFDSAAEIVGKADFELPWKNEAPLLREMDTRVIETGQMVSIEEPSLISDGRVAIFLSHKVPLKSETGETIGVLGVSVDVTSHKEAERLKLENELHKQTIQTQKKLAHIASQVAHDIGSPLASLKMLISSCDDLPESRRIAFRGVARSIEDITLQLLNQYNPVKASTEQIEERSVVFLPALVLQDLIQDRRMKHADSSIEFVLDISNDLYFEGLSAQRSRFTRMVSNLMNNAVEAMQSQFGEDHKPAQLSVRLKREAPGLKIQISDTGCGMPPEMVEKILSAVSFTQGKKEGHGIGLSQVRETLVANHGSLSIESIQGVGTTISLSFPSAGIPHWLGAEIRLHPNDLLVIVDDDPSIHLAWDQRFEKIQVQHPDLKIKHFIRGQETVDFLKTIPITQREDIFLLTDYEFLGQSITGLEVIQASGFPRSMVVTSHFGSQDLQARAIRYSTKLLPKPLASDVPICVAPKQAPDLIMIEDNEILMSSIQSVFGERLKIQFHTSAEAFFATHPEQHLDRDMRICIDNNFDCSPMQGLEIAERLHAFGFKNLILCSGDQFEQQSLPEYLTVIDKPRMNRFLQAIAARKQLD